MLMIVVFVLLALACLGVSLCPAVWRLPLWTLVILGCVVPWIGFQWHSHWSRVGWVPFVSGPILLRDLTANVALYVPFGWYFVRRPSAGARAWRWAVLAGVGLSLATELTQVYSHGRFPTMTDVVTNGMGAFIGALLGRVTR